MNTEFVDALGALDFSRMALIWAGTPTDTCVHPGWEILSSWAVIREAWRAIFAGTAYMRVAASDEQVVITGDTARVVYVEHIFTVTDDGLVHSRIAALNLMQLRPEGWRIVHHHGSPIATGRDSSEDTDDDEPN